MKLRAIRRKVAYIVGIVICITALIWLLLIDTKGRSDVRWLFYALAFLITGGLGMVCSYLLGNPENRTWLIFDILAPIFNIFFVITQFSFNQATDKSYKILVNLDEAYGSIASQVLPTIVLFISIITAVINVACLVVDIVLYAKIDKNAKEEFVERLSK